MYKQIEIYIVFRWLIHFGLCKTTDLLLYSNLWLLYSLRKCLHNKLKKVMRKGGEKQFITVTKFGATWTDNKSKLNDILDKASLKLAIDFLLDNCFLNFGNSSLQQTIEMSMDPTTYMAKLFLYYYVNKWLLHTKKRDSRKTHLFSNRFSFIDNLCLIWKNTSYE